MCLKLNNNPSFRYFTCQSKLTKCCLSRYPRYSGKLLLKLVLSVFKNVLTSKANTLNNNTIIYLANFGCVIPNRFQTIFQQPSYKE